MQNLGLLYDEALKAKKFRALIDQKTKIIQKHGKAGVLYLLQKENLGNCSFLEDVKDETCPWFQYKHDSPASAVTKIWSPLDKLLPQFLDLFKARCKYILTIEQHKNWQLIYLIEALMDNGTPFYLFYNGGAPIDEAAEFERRSISQKYQHNLGLFYQVHNGFGELYRESVLPFDELSKIKVDGIFYWSFFDFVSKARQCIKANELVLPNPITYDHDKGILQAYHPFWQFLDERLALIDE
ncbi:hypothetical protein [Aureispira sp. CCB-E]|uniref:hypothetical protein n=1 Tax=Aureispira sp. CCB-E TaxID=3051121 RepID=UPI00286860E4|nr:hypothetical protein [Aureispira sp. CCB-E]WMX12531.1 hypothetical protein QP953_17005 [Aureispira sp. CCB-E]